MIPLHYIIILSCLLLALPGLAAGFEVNNTALNQSYTNHSLDILSAPDILSIFNNPEQYLGKMIEIKGIVSKTSPRQHQFTVADLAGCSICAAKNARNSLTVIYIGEIPKNRETVQIFGLLENDTKKKYILNATSVVI